MTLMDMHLLRGSRCSLEHVNELTAGICEVFAAQTSEYPLALSTALVRLPLGHPLNLIYPKLPMYLRLRQMVSSPHMEEKPFMLVGDFGTTHTK